MRRESLAHCACDSPRDRARARRRRGVRLKDSDTIDSCYTLQTKSEVAKAEKTAEVAKAQPGAETSAGQVQSTVTDLIPLLNALGLLNESDTNEGTVAIDLNFLLPIAEAERNAQLSWLINIKPEVYEPLIDAFPEAVRDARKQALGDEIDDTADSKLQFTWSLVTERFGRDFRRQQATLDSMIAPITEQARKVHDRNQAQRIAYLQALQSALDDTGLIDRIPGADDLGKVKLESLDPQVRSRLTTAIATMAGSAGPYQESLRAEIKRRMAATGTNQLAKLVLQQPQLLFSAAKEFRDELVGLEAWSAKVTYEHTFVNLGHFLGTRGSACRRERLENLTDVAAANSCYYALTSYLQDHAEQLENEDRWGLSLEYRRFSSVDYAFPDDGVALSVPDRDRLIVGLGYGRVLPRSPAKDRIDFHLDYDSAVDDKANGKDRFVVSLTYTRRIKDVDIPFGLVYANKSEFLEGVDKTVSLHLGVKFSPEGVSDRGFADPAAIGSFNT